jgi:putative hemolysin
MLRNSSLRGVSEPLFSEHVALAITVVILIFLSAFFSGSETALFSLSRSMIEELERGGRRERMVAGLLRSPRMLLVTILFGNLLVNIASTSVVTALSIGVFGPKGIGIAVLVMTFIILIFGEISPKSIALKNATTLAVSSAPLLRFFMMLFTPIRMVLGRIADFAVEKSRVVFGERTEEYGAHELATAVELGHREGLFDNFEKEVLTNLFLFTETMVHEILVPRVEVFSLNIETTLAEALGLVRSRGFSRVPLYEGKDDNIVGILLAKDLLRYRREERLSLRNIMRSPIFVPETKHIRHLFGDLISAHQHMVIALDEHGSFAGILTLEDILEEIVGEIRNRREPRVEGYVLLDRDRIIVDGTMELEDLNEVFNTELDSPETETIAGFLIEEIGKIPRDGESYTVAGLRFLIISAEPTRVKKIKVERVQESGGEHGDI